jgi:hypothetical protein
MAMEFGVDVALDVALDVELGIDPVAAAAPALERAQAIDCDGLAVAVPYSQAKSVIDDDTLAAVPNAPAWLAGAANIEGHLVAVVDLHTWADPQRAPPAGRARLLLCASGDERLALRFQGLPQMVHVLADRDAAAGDTSGSTAHPAPPAALQPFCTGWAGATADPTAATQPATGTPPRRPLIDTAALARQWALQLAT